MHIWALAWHEKVVIVSYYMENIVFKKAQEGGPATPGIVHLTKS